MKTKKQDIDKIEFNQNEFQKFQRAVYKEGQAEVIGEIERWFDGRGNLERWEWNRLKEMFSELRGGK